MASSGLSEDRPGDNIRPIEARCPRLRGFRSAQRRACDRCSDGTARAGRSLSQRKCRRSVHADAEPETRRPARQRRSPYRDAGAAFGGEDELAVIRPQAHTLRRSQVAAAGP